MQQVEIYIRILPHPSLKTLNEMKIFCKYIVLILLLIMSARVSSQDHNEEIDSLVSLLKTAGREWNNYAIPLIEIGEPAIPALVEAVKDRSLSQWNRRISAMTLNSIHSPLWVQPALEILFDPTEDPVLRNHATAGLKGFNLTEVSDKLWYLFNEESNESYKSNLANLLMTADTSLAYKAFKELYNTCEGHLQRGAMMNLVIIRPRESTIWFLKALLSNDWMTANLAMDSLVVSEYFDADALISVFSEPGSGEEVKWRITYIFGHRAGPESISLLTEALQDEYWLVHTEATVGLCRFKPENVIPEMTKLKNDSRTYVRNNSRWVIQNIK